MYRDVILIFSVFVLSACATMETQTFKKSPLVRPGAKVELGTVSIPAGKSYKIDAAGLMRDSLQEALTESGIIWEDDDKADRFVLNVLVGDYAPGNAFKRWLMPGYGSTILHVTGSLIDNSTGEVSGELDYERSVFIGGAFTIGAWRTIFQSVADDIAKDLGNRIEKKGFVVSLKPWAAREIDIPDAVTKQTFTFSSVTDSRPDQWRIGQRTAAFDVSMGDVFFSRPVADFMEETIASELRGAGH
jgi:hypothetical protein